MEQREIQPLHFAKRLLLCADFCTVKVGLCGKAVGLRYSWDNKKQSFVKRQGIEKMILVLDGTWSQKDIDALTYAGWDGIFYPDEIEKLKDAIV